MSGGLRNAFPALLLAAGAFPVLCSLRVPVGATQEDAKPAVQRPVALLAAPPWIVLGAKSRVTVRGLALEAVEGVHVVSGPEGAKASIAEKGAAPVLNGLVKEKVGDTRVELDIELSVDPRPAGPPVSSREGPAGGGPAQRPVERSAEASSERRTSELRLRLVGAGGDSGIVSLQVLEPATGREEEPNDSFAAPGRLAVSGSAPVRILGSVGKAQDVDVFEVSGTPGAPLRVEVAASRSGTLLDPSITVYDGHGHSLASDDDSAGGRDARLVVRIPAEGRCRVVLQDANDQGGELHGYLLTLWVKEEP